MARLPVLRASSSRVQYMAALSRDVCRRLAVAAQTRGVWGCPLGPGALGSHGPSRSSHYESGPFWRYHSVVVSPVGEGHVGPRRALGLAHAQASGVARTLDRGVRRPGYPLALGTFPSSNANPN